MSNNRRLQVRTASFLANRHLFKLPQIQKPSPQKRRRSFHWSALESLEPRVLLAAAVPTGPEVRLNDNTTSIQKTTHVTQQSIASNEDGMGVAVWSSLRQDGSSWGVFGQLLDEEGLQQGSEFRINQQTARSQKNASVAIREDGTFAVVWESWKQDGSAYGIYARVFGPDGTPLGNEFLVNSTTTGSQVNPALAWLESGELAVAWSGRGAEDPRGVYVRLFDETGVATSNALHVNETRLGSQAAPVISGTVDGGFLVAWEGRGSGDRRGVFLKEFDETGHSVTGEQRVNRFTQSVQSAPAIASADDGTLTIVWQGLRQDGSVFGRQYLGGELLETEFRVNDTTTRSQYQPAIAYLEDGGFVVAWTGNGTGDNFGVFTREFDADATPAGESVLVNSSTQGLQYAPSVTATNFGYEVVWSGHGEGDNFGVFARSFEFSDEEPVNSAPVLTLIPDQQGTTGTALTFTATASDPEENTLAFSLDGAPAGAQIVDTTGEFSWTPTEEQAGDFSFDVVVTDPDGLTDRQTVLVTVVAAVTNHAPSLTAVADQTVDEGMLLTVQVVASDPDASDSLTYTLVSSPAGAVVDPQSGQLTWMPDEAVGPGEFDVTVRVTDSGSLSDETTFQITVNEVNQAPTITSIPNQDVTAGQTLTLVVQASDDDLPANVLTYALEQGAPAGATIDAETGELTWLVPLDQPAGTVSIDVRVTDDGGLSSTASVPVTVQAVTSLAALAEGSRFVSEAVVPIPTEGLADSGEVRVDFSRALDNSDQVPAVEDVFSVTLLDGENVIETLFTQSGSVNDFTPGKVRFDGSSIWLDSSLVKDLANPQLQFQLINSDADEGTSYAVTAIASEGEASELPMLTLESSSELAQLGPSRDLQSLAATTELHLTVNNVHYNSQSHLYTAELRLRNDGQNTLGRAMVVVLTNLPAVVRVDGASGTTADGSPYLNFETAVPEGGLPKGQSTAPIELVIDNPQDVRFSLLPTILAGGLNHAPDFAALGPLSVMPGEALSIPLQATDADGDRVMFSIAAETSLPNVMLSADNRLVVQPAPDQLGHYEFELIARDGSTETRQTVVLDVVADPVTVTRISGRVLDTNEMPLSGVEVQLGRFQATTAADGSFTIEVPSFLTPTEAFDIIVPPGDPEFDSSNTGTQTIDLRRAGFDLSTGDSVDNPRQHQNLVTAFLDGSVVYGSSADRAGALRTMAGNGKLKVSDGNLLPLNNPTFFPDGALENENNGQEDPSQLFVAGDVRANDNVDLMALQTLLVREHNRKAEELAAEDPSLSDDELYEGARRWVIALLQHVTYSEFLPVLLGQGSLPQYSGYDPNVDPQISGVFSVAAFRIGHSMASEDVLRLDESGQSLTNGALSLKQAFSNPEPITNDGIDPYLRGMVAQQVQEVDAKLTNALRNFLFGPAGAGGLDLISLNIQRGRDMGLPSYNQARVDFGLSPVTSFSEISASSSVQQELAAVYDTVDDIDLVVGGLAEDHAPGAMVGELFAAIIRDQFLRTRDGDRLWYENSQFTSSELDEIQATSLADLILRNTDIQSLPDQVMINGVAPQAPALGGTAATGPASETRQIDGTGNNPQNSATGSTGQDLNVNYTLDYGDEISTPAGADRSSARAISNAVFDQNQSILNSTGATTMMMIWGQLLAHDLSLTPGGTDNTLKVHGDTAPGTNSYPFVAEKLPQLFGHAVYPGVNNVLPRPIYLPAIDTVNAVTIDPNQDTMVTTAALPDASLFVKAGTLQDRNGNLFDAQLSITEVPRSLTPASLPKNLLPDTVVTIQPAEMVFTTPAPLTFPNRAGYAPGTLMDLWSINPVTGQFDDVGDAQVTADGNLIETTSGGIRNSSWHFFTPVTPVQDSAKSIDANEDNLCDEQKAKETFNSEVELHSGAVLEDHPLITYQSLDSTVGFDLHYDSLRADPRPIVQFGFSSVTANPNQRLVASIELTRGDLTFQVPGYAGSDYGLQGGEHIWNIDQSGTIRAALQVDLTDLETGLYDYNLTSGILQFDGTNFSGTSATSTEKLRIVNAIHSPFGAGWGLSGLTELVENPDGSVLMVDGGGSELLFGAPTTPGGPFVSPPGNFSTLIKQSDGTFQQTMTDQTVYRFNANNQIASITDRNGNQTQFEYDSDGTISRISDPTGQETTFTASNGRVTSIVDPANRAMMLEYDANGNLIKVTDPDGTSRNWEYDFRHHMTAEVDKRGLREETYYDFAGRADHSIRKDGSLVQVDPLQTQILLPSSATSDPFNAPSIALEQPASTKFADANGNVTEVIVDQKGQAVSSRDNAGTIGLVSRTAQNLVDRSLASRGFRTEYTYDQQGNTLTIGNEVGSATGGSLFVTGHDSDSHANGDYQRAGLDFLTFSKQAQTPEEIDHRSEVVIGYLGTRNGTSNGAIESGYTNRTFINLDDPHWAEIAFNGTFDVLMVGTGLDFVSTSGSAALNAEAESFADFFNAGGGIYVNTDENRIGQSFYGFLPAFGATQAARGGTGVYTATEAGLLIGLTEAIVDKDPTHTEYKNVDTNIFRVFETHNQTGDPVAIGLFQGFITGGSFGLATTHYEYDPTFSQVTSVTDELGRQTLFNLDSTTGNVLKQTQVVGELDSSENGETDDLITTFTYTTFGLVDTLTDPLGHITDFDYDSFGRMIAATFAVGTPDQAARHYEYDLAGNQTAMVDENGHRTEYAYDVMNRLVTMTEPDPDGSGPLTSPVTHFTYDQNGNVLTTTDARGNTTTNAYDPMNRLASSTDAQGNETDFAYDEFGNLATTTDPLGQATQNFYDARNRLVRSVDPDGGVTRYTYDGDNNLTSLTDPVGNITRFQYDARNRLVADTDPLGQRTTYVYDSADNLIRKTDRLGRITEYVYDDLNRLLTENWLGPDGSTVANTIAYSYDRDSNLLSVTDDFSSLAYSYDARDRLLTVDNQNTPQAPHVGLAYTYDGVGNVLSVIDTINGTAGARTGYQYDALNRTIQETQSGQGVSPKRAEFTYNPLGQYASIQRSSDLAGTQHVATSNYLYDNLNRLEHLVHVNSTGGTLAFYDFTYDADSRITSINDIDGLTTYSYDNRDELTGADRAETDPRGDESYTYDANGNRLDSHLHGTEYVTGPGNRLLSDGTYDYEYDAEGNMTKRTDIATGNYREFAWDHRNRLISVTDFSAGGIITQVVDFVYDALDRRITKTVDLDGDGPQGPQSTQFVYDREDVILDFTDADGLGAAQQPILAVRYFHGPGIDQVLAQEVAGQGTQWLLTDHLGTTREIISNGGAILNHITYDSYGNVIGRTSESSRSRFLFTGREYDQETDMHFLRSRYYNSTLGRFATEDSLRFKRGDSNLFIYVKNDSIKQTDPYGDFGLIGAATGFVAGFTGGFVSGGVRGALVGGIAGGAVGFINPFASSSVGAAAGAVVANIIGQGIGNTIDTGDPFSRFDPISTVFAATGATFGASVARTSLLYGLHSNEAAFLAGITSGAVERLQEEALAALRRTPNDSVEIPLGQCILAF